MGQPSTNPVITPRITNFTREQMINLIEQDKKLDDEVETFGALPVSCSTIVSRIIFSS